MSRALVEFLSPSPLWANTAALVFLDYLNFNMHVDKYLIEH